MNSRLNIPVAISYVRKSAIQSFTSSLSGSCQVMAEEWITIPFVKGSVDFETSSKKAAGGRLHTTELTANLTELFEENLPVLVKVEFEDSDTLIIGIPDYPVTFDVEYTLTRKRIKFTHKNLHKPLKLVS